MDHSFLPPQRLLLSLRQAFGLVAFQVAGHLEYVTGRVVAWESPDGGWGSWLSGPLWTPPMRGETAHEWGTRGVGGREVECGWATRPPDFVMG